jgi:transposase
MAGTLDGLSDLEWKLFADVLPPEPTKRGRGMPHVPYRKVVNTLLYVLITGCHGCDLPRGDASPPARAGRRTRDDSVALWGGGWVMFPLAQAAVRASRMAGKAKASCSTV